MVVVIELEEALTARVVIIGGPYAGRVGLVDYLSTSVLREFVKTQPNLEIWVTLDGSFKVVPVVAGNLRVSGKP